MASYINPYSPKRRSFDGKEKSLSNLSPWGRGFWLEKSGKLFIKNNFIKEII
jgi:hypothetical protein